MGEPISIKLATEVDLGETFQKPKWFCFLPFSSRVSGGYHLTPPNHVKTCSYRSKFGIA